MDDFGANKQVVEILNDYISLKNPQFAILINGKWGCGKSWLIKKYIDYITVNSSEINEYSIECKNICYISLFGFKNIDEIDNAVFRYFHPILTSQKTSLLGNIGDFIFDKIPFSFSLPINKKDIKKVGEIIKSLLPNNKDDLILILDDFERNEIDPQTLFGYINNHLEKYHAKVIIISNSEEIENDKFKDIKEKVIGQTVTVVPDISNSFTDNIDKIADLNIKDIFLRNKDKLLTIFNNSNSHNLRNIIKIIFEFSRIYKHIEESYKSNIELIDKILIDNFIMSIEIHSNLNKLFEMVDLESQSWKRKNNDDKTKKYNHITFIYSKYNTNYIIFNPKFWYEFIFNGIISQEILNYGCKKFIEELEINKNSLPLRLYDFYTMDENEIKELLCKMKEQLYKNEYRKLGIFLHAWSILIESLKFDFISDTQDDIFSQFKKNIDTIEFELNDDDYSDHYRDDLSWYHRNFRSANSTIFENIYYISLDKYNAQYINYKENKVKDIIEGLSLSFDEYIKNFIGLIENFTGFFVKSVTPKDFVNILLNMTNDKLRILSPHLINLIKIHLHNYFNTNYDLTVWKNEFIGQLTQSITQCKHKLAKHTLNILIDDLKKLSS